MRAALALSLASLVMAACGPAPGASVTTLLGGPAAMTFGGLVYAGFGARLTAPSPPDDTLVIPRDALRPIGLATEADPAMFPDRQVFAVRGVDPRDAVVMFDQSTPAVGIEMVVFTRGGTSPTQVDGLCDYYSNPALRLCHAASSR